ncbi:2-amino-4-hydroxy-6-hydroxymethyldihydropteridine diphosphokinase [Maribius pontilimi]|uniref:2-amino-4-hydroxy-6-hydroxymethyldihydropteridine pyrophosphokinase n=1 Tax=Palleronia pontilimi TaxID=1964209 RepID=A0A934IBR9_9RHOB|nr:2-amino-4-hydroxy-6-hydroxymethyldihydropteridine diphosphokinase [Palleronia pontilimi]MBJ3764199.1 2-amino-4-hydroxy-6-hydroxymethyldihydropteridine diphosphokinase [Palleronia pontilimi]
MTDVTQRHAFVALGANLPGNAGKPAQMLLAALHLLDTKAFRLQRVSRLMRTPAFPAGSGPDFVNAVALFQTALDADRALAHLHAVEAELGRARDGRWAARTIDLDLLALGDRVVPDREVYLHWHDLPFERQKREAPDQPILPHPRLHERAFVLVPMAEIAPDWRHPVLGLDVAGMLARLPAGDVAAIRPISDPD